MAKDFRTFAEEAGSEKNLYLKRLKLTDTPMADWTDDDVQLALVCSFPWMQWMQLIRNGGEW